MILALGPILVLLGLHSKAYAVRQVDLELVLATDVSSSISAEELSLQRQGYAAALLDPRVISAIRRGPLGRIAVAYIEWGGIDYRKTITGWTVIEGAAGARRIAAAIMHAPVRLGQGTSISRAIEFSIRLLEGNEITGTRRIIDISGDGPNNVGGFVATARDTAVALGITINGLPIFNRSNNAGDQYGIPDIDAYYRGCVIGGAGAFMVVAKDVGEFAGAIRKKLILEIAGSFAPGPRRGRAENARNSYRGFSWRNRTPLNGLAFRPFRPAILWSASHRYPTGIYPPGCDIGERKLDYWYTGAEADRWGF